MRLLPLTLLLITLMPAAVAAQGSKSDEPHVKYGKVERFGPKGRVFATDGARKLVLRWRRSYAAEHGAGFIGEFRVIESTTPRISTERAYRFETVCASQRKGYRLVRATADGAKDPDEAYSMSVDETNRKPGAAEKAAYNLYYAACRKKFLRFR